MEHQTIQTMLLIGKDQLEYGEEYAREIHGCTLPANGLALDEWMKGLRKL